MIVEGKLKSHTWYHVVPKEELGETLIYLNPQGIVTYLQEGLPRSYTKDTVMMQTGDDGKVVKVKSMSLGQIG